MTQGRSFLPDVLKFLEEHFGLSIGFADPDDSEISIEAHDISAEALKACLLELYAGPMRHHLRAKRARAMRVCIGGPRDGQPHNGDPWQRVVVFHERRGEWSVYEVVAEIASTDRRAWFRGYATSRAKAVRKQCNVLARAADAVPPHSNPAQGGP